MNAAQAASLRPGQPVSHSCDLQTEYGIVVAVWLNEHGFIDTYVAFFGEAWPDDQGPKEIPYVLKYAASSLKLERLPT